MSLSDNVTRKFVESINVSDWEVETEDGFVDILSSNKTIEYEVYEIILDTGLRLKCADTHILIDSDYNEIFAKNSLGCHIRTKLGNSKVIRLDNLGYSENMYDLSIDSDKHTFYTNDILSHNTTTVAAYLVWYCVFNESKNVAMLGNKVAAAREVMARFQLMYEELPIWLQQGVVEWNKGSVALENKSKAFIAATTASGIRGKSVNLLYLDELSSVPGTVAEEFFASTYPTISSGESSKVIITSTPIGFNHFWKMWDEAERNINGFIHKRVEYWEHPLHNEVWAAKQKQLLGEIKYNQEVLMHFLGSSYTLIGSDVMSKMRPISYIHSNNGLDIIEYPIQFHSYVMVVDTSKGVGGDYSAFTVIDVTQLPYKVVAKYRDNNISPLLYPNVIYKIANDYNEAFVLMEINSSEQVSYILHADLEYENILSVGRNSKGQCISGGFGGQSRLGVNTDKKIKRIGCNNLKTLIEENKLLVYDADIIAEFSTFIESKGSYAADDGYHDDLVMTLVLFAWLTTDPYFTALNNIDMRKSIYEDRMKLIDEQMVPTGWLNDGNESDKEIMMNF
jgi:hypothetical protein